MAITPHTDLRLLKVPINIDNQNQLTFANANAQYNYFNSLDKLEVDNFTYQRKDGIIRYPAHIDSIINYNYCMYQNSNYTNKWFYAFITGMTYINDNMTEIAISTDVYQTWQFDIDIKTSYVEREHVNNDSVGANTFPEGLETGEYTIKDYQYLGDTQYYTVFSTSWNPFYSYNSSSQKYEGKTASQCYGGVTNGSLYIIMENYNSVDEFLRIMAYQGKNEQIVGAFIVPKSMIYTSASGQEDQPIPDNWWTKIKYGDGTFSYVYGYQYVTPSNGYKTLRDATITPTFTDLVGYTPKNKKLFTYPYSFIEVDNSCGAATTYRYEEFDLSSEAGAGNIYFKLIGTPSPGCSCKLFPLYYKRMYQNHEEGLAGAKLPICSFQVDMYTNWLTQNSLNRQLSVAQDVFNIGANLLSGNISGAVNGVFGIGQTMAEKEKHKMIPAQVEGNTNNGDIEFSFNKSRAGIYQKCIKKEYAEKIDNFFSMFGYRVNITKVPNVWGRTNWNYVKTIDVNIEGYIPQTDLQAIKDMFNNGVTFWHNPATFLDYSQTNAIVS